MTEAALNSEPIPLGHRQTIRAYFELIRPQGDEAEKADHEGQTPEANGYAVRSCDDHGRATVDKGSWTGIQPSQLYRRC